jgi:hypothetical protein
MIEFTLIRFQEQLKIRLTEIQRQTTGLEDLRKDRRLLQATANRLTDAIAATSPPALLSKLAEVGTCIGDLDRRMDEHKQLNISATAEGMRDFVYRSLLHEDASTSKDASRARSGGLSSNRNRRRPDRYMRSRRLEPAGKGCNVGGGQGRNRYPYPH